MTSTPAADLDYHARITDIVRGHLALHGGLRPTAFVEAEDEQGMRIVVIDAQDLGDQSLFIDFVRRTSVELLSDRAAIASEAVIVEHDDPHVLARVHAQVAADPSILETHPLMRKGVSIQVESDAGTTTSFHSLRRHHPEMAELMPTHTSFQPSPPEARIRLIGFHVPAALREGEEISAVLGRTRHLSLGAPADQPAMPDA